MTISVARKVDNKVHFDSKGLQVRTIGKPILIEGGMVQQSYRIVTEMKIGPDAQKIAMFFMKQLLNHKDIEPEKFVEFTIGDIKQDTNLMGFSKAVKNIKQMDFVLLQRKRS